MRIASRIELWCKHYFLILIGILCITLQVFRGGGILVDPFHQGEFYAAAASYFGDVEFLNQPFVIHGALDYLPAILARYCWGSDNYFLPTFFVYKALDFFATLILIFISNELTRYRKNQALILLAVAIGGPLFVGYRDLFLLLDIYLFLVLIKLQDRSRYNVILQLLMGIVLAFGVFWSFDRGICGFVALGAAITFLSFNDRRYGISILTFIFAMIGLSHTFDAFSTTNYIANIVVLLKTSAQWSYDFHGEPQRLTIFAVALNSLGIFLFALLGLRSKILKNDLPIIILLTLISVFFLKIGINRADVQHIYYSCWAPILILFFIFNKYAPDSWIYFLATFVTSFAGYVLGFLYKAPGFFIVSFLLLLNCSSSDSLRFRGIEKLCFVVICVVFFMARFWGSDYRLIYQQYSWINLIASPPANWLSVTDGVSWAAKKLEDRNVNCVFDLSNNGVVNGLLKRPSCSKFTYPVYADASYEDSLIFDLNESSPVAIIYSSTYWSYSIDGRSMKQRFPKLDRFILQKYSKIECDYGYCVRYLD